MHYSKKPDFGKQILGIQSCD